MGLILCTPSHVTLCGPVKGSYLEQEGGGAVCYFLLDSFSVLNVRYG